MLLRRANAIKAWANAIKMPDQHKYQWKWISDSYRMVRRGVQIFMLLRRANAIKAWANAIKMPDQHKYQWKWISDSYRMVRRGVQIFIIGFNYF